MPCQTSTNATSQQPTTVLPQSLPQNQGDWSRFTQRLQEILGQIQNAQTTTGVNVIPTQESLYDGTALPGIRVTGATSALDNTNVRFGAASLKLTATATTITLTLGASGYPATIHPYWKWIGSVYLMTSRATIAGTMDLVTAVGSKAVDISGTTSGWVRLYGDYDLTADASTSATLTLTLTGLTVGDTFNVEAWQLEPVQGTTSLPSPYITTSAPRTWAQIVNDGLKPANNADVTASNTSLDTAHVNSVPSASISPIATLMPAQAGADVTASNTAADTSNVAGTPAATVVNTANTANSLATQVPVINGGFDATPYGTGWTMDAQWSIKSDGAGPGVGLGYALFTPNGSNGAIYNSGKVGVIAGQTYKAQGLIRGSGTPNGSAYVRIRWLDSTGTQIAYKNGNIVTGNVTTGSYAVDQAPAGAFYAATSIEVDSCTVGLYQLDNVVATLMPTNQSEVPNGGGHNSVTAIDGNGLALIDFTQAGHVSKNLDNIGDGPTTYQRMPTANMDVNRRALADFSQTGHLNKTLQYMPDGGGRYGVHAVDSNNLALVDFSQGGHVNKTLDYIPDTSTRFAAVLSPTVQSGMYAPGSNLILNPNFALGMSDWTNGGWSSYSLNGEPCALINPPASAATTLMYSNVVGGLSAGAALSASLEMFLNQSLTAGDISADIQWLGASGAISTSARLMTIGAANGGFVRYKAENQIAPTGTTSCYMRVFTEGASSTSAAVFVRRCKLEVGSVATPFNDAATQHGNQLTVSGSGQRVGDQRNLLQRTITNYPANIPTAITYSSTTTSATISIAAFTVLAGSVSVSYNAMSVSTTGTAGTTVTYWLYFNDPGYAGGTQTLIATTNRNDIYAGDGYVYAGKIDVVYPASGTSGGSGTCVCDDMFIDEDTLAGEASIGHLFDCLDVPTQGLRKFRRRLQSVEYDTVPCVRITTSEGAVLECSTTTPFDVLDGRTVYAPDMLGEDVVTDRGIEIVSRVDDIGERRVCHIHLGGVSYAAGLDPAHRIFSHNLKP